MKPFPVQLNAAKPNTLTPSVNHTDELEITTVVPRIEEGGMDGRIEQRW